MTRDSFRDRRTRICTHPTRASPVPEKSHVCLMVTLRVVLHTQPKHGLAEREIAATHSQNTATAEPVPTSAPGQRELLKNYKLRRGAGEKKS